MKAMKSLGSALFTLISLMLVLALAGCATDPAPKHRYLRLYVLDCGSIDVPDIALFQPGVDAGQPTHLADTCYLIVHPKGVMLWDAGLPDRLASLPSGQTTPRGFTLHVHKTLRTQLEEIGYPPKTVQLLGLSHMHGDHVGNVDLFRKATLLIQKPEYDAAFGKHPQQFGFNPADYGSLRHNPLEILRGDHDVFGDGSVVIKFTPGHTPGHQSLFLRLARTGNIVLSGDLVHYSANWENRRVPSFNFDKATTEKSMETMAKFLQDENATLWIQHDAEQNAEIRHAPYFYE